MSSLVRVAILLGAGSVLSMQPARVPVLHHAHGYYDEGLGRVVLVGAAVAPRDGERDGVWSWSGTRWEPVTDSGPVGRTNAAAAYDARRGIAIFNGGARRRASDSTQWAIVGDGWEQSRGGAWRPGAPIDARDHHAMVDDGRGLLLFGGIGPTRASPWPGDTWRLSDGAWTRVATDGPPGRGRTAMAFDAARGQVVLFGGASGPDSTGAQVFFGDTWTWDGARWRLAVPHGAPGAPRGRYAHAMVYDERARVVLLYTGAGAHRNAPLADLWQWDGTRWTEIPLTGPTPGHRYQPVMVYDRARGRTVLYGGLGPNDGGTWEWDGARWSRVGL